MLSRTRLTLGAAMFIGLSVLFYLFPLFHIVPLKQVEEKSQQSAFEPSTFVDHFWIEKLLPGTKRAVLASDLVAALQTDHKSAKEKYARRTGMSSVYYYFVAGEGRVVSIDKSSIGLAISEDFEDVEIGLMTGKIFGNAVRDGTGLIDLNDIPSSQDFNAVSSEINSRIEKVILPVLRERAAVGVRVRFVGCAEIVDEDTDLKPLKIVPFVVEVQGP